MSEIELTGLKALAHPLRFRIMQALRSGERNVGEIEAATAIGQPGLSQQLAVLRKAELVTTRRKAKQIYYTSDARELAQQLDALQGLLPEDYEEAASNAQNSRESLTSAAVFARVS